MLMGRLRVSLKGLKISEIACKGMLAVNGWIAITWWHISMLKSFASGKDGNRSKIL